mmetsp:Transcript_13050/g.26250  ORF Transcript_13050/g.26250 Transcript_13050/m.26250 type:complete len:80 (+) Transcript_13050:162-401(+)
MKFLGNGMHMNLSKNHNQVVRKDISAENDCTMVMMMMRVECTIVNLPCAVTQASHHRPIIHQLHENIGQSVELAQIAHH